VPLGSSKCLSDQASASRIKQAPLGSSKRLSDQASASRLKRVSAKASLAWLSLTKLHMYKLLSYLGTRFDCFCSCQVAQSCSTTSHLTADDLSSMRRDPFLHLRHGGGQDSKLQQDSPIEGQVGHDGATSHRPT
jgi:hypothetical protein